jgi:hypothetical protein
MIVPGLQFDPAKEALFEGIPVENLPKKPTNASEALRQKMRKRGLEDSYYFTKVILGYKKLVPHVHGTLCRFLDSCNINRRAIEMPRSHYKTTVATIAKNIQRACKNPNVRILIIAGTSANAERFMMEIRKQFEANELLRWLYPDVLPEDMNKVRWNDHELELRRTEYWREPTFDAIGAGAMVESRHYDHITADDLIGWKQFNSDLEMEKIITWSDGMEALLINDSMTIDIVGSLWKRGDVYDHIKEGYAADQPSVPIGPFAVLRGEIAIFNRGAIENGQPIFPEEVSLSYLLRIMKRNPEYYAAQYGNNPIAGGLMTFDKDWIRYFKLHETKQGFRILKYDREGNFLGALNPMELRIIILYDPAKSEKRKSARNAMHVVALNKTTGEVFVLESHVGMYKPNEAVDKIFSLDEKWHPELISIEAVGYQGALKYWITERAQRTRKPYPPIVEYYPGSEMDKDQRIRGLQPIMRVGELWIQEHMVDLIEEITFHPTFRYKDALDALAQILAYIENTEDEEAEEEAALREEAFLMTIDETGYGIKRGAPQLDGMSYEELSRFVHGSQRMRDIDSRMN